MYYLESEATWLTRKAAAKRLSASVSTVDRLVRRGQLASYALGPRLIRFRVEDVDALLKRERAS